VSLGSADLARVLAGRTALVTGASRGVGLAVARALAGAGARVALLARSADVLEREAAALGGGAFAVTADVTLSPDVERAAARVIAAFGAAPDVLVNSAGIFTLAAAHEQTVASFVDTINANLVAPFTVTRAFLPAMRERGSGSIITIGSIADRAAFPENGAYAASKFGLRGLHEVLRAELRGTGVRATLVSPGPVDTPLWDPIDPDNRPGFSPRASMLRPEAVAAAVLYAVSQPAAVNVDELRLSAS
jgi:NAD(P)-dependent dehydrogenase (short-subunit alcohol dehydrogenase family)